MRCAEIFEKLTGRIYKCRWYVLYPMYDFSLTFFPFTCVCVCVCVCVLHTLCKGWVAVDKHTTQHVKYPNVFSLGDASSLPTSKTAAAAASQSGVVVWNLVAALERVNVDNPANPAEYNGYTSCPLVPGSGKIVLAELDYTLQPRETFEFVQ